MQAAACTCASSRIANHCITGVMRLSSPIPPDPSLVLYSCMLSQCTHIAQKNCSGGGGSNMCIHGEWCKRGGLGPGTGPSQRSGFNDCPGPTPTLSFTYVPTHGNFRGFMLVTCTGVSQLTPHQPANQPYSRGQSHLVRVSLLQIPRLDQSHHARPCHFRPKAPIVVT